MRVMSMSVHFLTHEVSMRSRSHVLVEEDRKDFSVPCSDTGLKDDKVARGLVTWIGDDDWKPDLILIIFSLRRCLNTLAMSINFLCHQFS